MDDVFGDGMFVRYCKCIVGATMVCDNTLMQWYIVCGTTRSGTRRGQKFHKNGCVSVWSEGHVLSDVFGDEMFVRFDECICGVGIVYDNTLMQWYIVIQRVAECGEVKSFTRMGNGEARYI